MRDALVRLRSRYFEAKRRQADAEVWGALEEAVTALRHTIQRRSFDIELSASEARKRRLSMWTTLADMAWIEAELNRLAVEIDIELTIEAENLN